jgi:ribulose-5-phosphate 4-epimerase/fuculose-1-phosphate aldolase
MSKYDDEKSKVLAAARWLSENGYFGGKLGSGGNVSVRDPGDGRIVITPSGLPYRAMGAADICVIDADRTQIEGNRPPSMEAGMHIAIYQGRPAVGAVVHTHSVFASVFALINRPIPPLLDEITCEIGPRVKIIPYAISGSPELAHNVAAALDDVNACYIIQNHGALSLGRDLEKALRNAELLEKIAQVYYHALGTGAEITTLPDAAVQELMGWRQEKT